MTAMLMGPGSAMTTTAADAPDADLVAASRRGDREAFGRIVRRYQGMVTGLLYAGCGDLHRSEDLAQETFVSAWRSLSGLREPAKLPAWLCQVARHRLLDDARSQTRHDARLAGAFHNRGDADTSPSPEQQVLSDEERELLWRTLREIPQPYRETMVLYYRQGKSADEVALATDTTEANVRQRLARGREMLREQVASMLERNLVRSAPGPAFALAVIAALPALIPQTASAAVATTTLGLTAKGAAASAKGTGLLAVLAMAIGPIMGVVGGAFGTWMSIRAATNPRERKFVVRSAVQIWAFVIGSMAVLFGMIWARRYFGWSGRTLGLMQCAFWVAYTVLLVWFIVTLNRRQRRIRREEGLPEQPTVAPLPGGAGRVLAVALAFGTVGAMTWMLTMAAQARDTLGMTLVAAVATVMATVGYAYVRRRPPAESRRFVFLHASLLGVFTFVMANWRFHLWIAGINGMPLDDVRQRVPVWIVNLMVGVCYGMVLVICAVSWPRPAKQP